MNPVGFAGLAALVTSGDTWRCYLSAKVRELPLESEGSRFGGQLVLLPGVEAARTAP